MRLDLTDMSVKTSNYEPLLTVVAYTIAIKLHKMHSDYVAWAFRDNRFFLQNSEREYIWNNLRLLDASWFN